MLFSAILAILLAQLTIAQPSNLSCSCFLTNGSSAGYFTSHSFFDFRNIDTSPSTIPPLLADMNSTANAPRTSDYFSIESFSTRLPTFQSAAEIDTIAHNYHYISLRVLARVQGSPGACAGIFTYLPSSNPRDVQEADIEILTSGPRSMVQFTNQPSETATGGVEPQATVNGTNPGGEDWTEWVAYRVDWLPGKTTWYANGQMTAEIGFQAPRDPATIILNMWSDGGSWTGNMSIYDEAYLQLQWLEMVYNTSGPVSGSSKRSADLDLLQNRNIKGCETVCSIDENVNAIGSPMVISNHTGAATREQMGNVAWISVVISSIANRVAYALKNS
ncbi:Beta-glucanase [Hyphodiscus hymeniophilus]|uniref:Beta-glucanase n=1 Tax=Hyphodiscus hymeniophilus TaxID=353542 RepID=A0A9P7AUE4_9HELO|nr:Beta-glucanase [Hyphodiscus hymeniophilus]